MGVYVGRLVGGWGFPRYISGLGVRLVSRRTDDQTMFSVVAGLAVVSMANVVRGLAASMSLEKNTRSMDSI